MGIDDRNVRAVGPRQYGRPLLVSKAGAEPQIVDLAPVQLRRNADDSFDEDWLQDLIFQRPGLLPISELEPSLSPCVAVCRELPTRAGPVDNLFVTPTGGLVLVECKLWRNPEARRQVVAQIIDYADALSRSSYEDLEQALGSAKGFDGQRPDSKLYNYVADADVLSEAEFVDAVTRNLKLGRFLLLIVGDGIRQGAENLAEYLQLHAGAHFTLGLVELSVHRLPEHDTYLVQPRILARTINIERGIVRMETDGPVISAPAEATKSLSAGGGRRTSITHEMFYEQLAISDPSLPRKLQEFIERLEPLGVLPDLKRAMSLKWQRPDGQSFNLASIASSEKVRTDPLEWAAETPEEKSVCRSYIEALAEAIDGNVIKNDKSWFVSKDSNPPTIVMLLGVQDQWLAAIEAFTDRMTRLSANES